MLRMITRSTGCRHPTLVTDGGRLPVDFWTTPTAAGALANCNLPVLMELVRAARGWSQADLASALGYSQSWVSRVLRRHHMLTVDQVREIARKLDIPLHLLRIGGGDDPTKRREFGRTVAAAGLAILPVPHTGAPDIGEDTALTLRAITAGQRRLDGAAPARDLVGTATAHAAVSNRLLARCAPPLAPQIAAAASEAAGFAAWLHVDMRDGGTARRYYRMAVERACMADLPVLAAYMIGSLAAFEIDDGDPLLGLDLARRAQRQLGDHPPPTARAWLGCICALGHATTGAAGQADQALIEVGRALDQVNEADRPPWPWMFPFDHAKAAGYRALVSVRLGRHVDAAAAFSDAIPMTPIPPKQHALLSLEMAEAELQDATQHHRTDQVDHAFAMARNALRIGVTYSSERVIHRARKLRHAYRGPATTAVTQFDDEMRTTLP